MGTGKTVAVLRDSKRLRRYSLGEEIFNSVSHGAGALLSVAGTVVLIVPPVQIPGILIILPVPAEAVFPIPQLLRPAFPLQSQQVFV